MPVTYTNDWAQEVADISGLEEHQNAEIEIRDPLQSTMTGDPIAGYTITGDVVLWSGRARIASNRSSVSAGGTTSTNPTNVKAVRVQIPYDPDFMRVRRGWQVRVTNGGRNSRLEDYLLSIESDVNSSHVGSLTFECTIDVESDPNWVEDTP